MDSGRKIKRERNPRETASVVEKILFLFTFKTIRKGIRRDLKEDDIYEITNDLKSENWGNKLERLWKNELLQANPSFVKSLFKLLGLQYTALWLSLFLMDLLNGVVKPMLIGKVVSYFSLNTTIGKNETLLNVGCLILLNLLYSIYDPTFYVYLETLQMKLRIACSSLLYRKCLKLNENFSTQYASGKIVTLITKDVAQITTAIGYIFGMANTTIYLVIMSYFMYRAIGVASLAGSSLLFVLLPLHFYLGRKAAMFRLQTLNKTDQRVRLTQEIFTAIRIIKMYTWELFFSNSLKKLRNEEVKSLRCLLYLKAFGLSIGELSSRLAFYLCVVTYLSLGNHITAEKAFIVVGGFSSLDRMMGRLLPEGIAQLLETNASVNRIISFLLLNEVISTECDANTFTICNLNVENVTVRTDEGVKILRDVNMEINQGLTFLTGNVGSGKSTLLKVLLGDVKMSQGTVAVSGKISYASQEPWLFPSTVQQNIIFAERFNRERYKKVVEVCALRKDFSSWPQGDQTLLVDKGLNLSRGQKTRINLARAIYREADIYLIDDCLSAVDSRVGKHIFDECIRKFLKGKICLLVAHQSEFFNDVDNVIVLNRGVIQGPYESIINANHDVSKIEKLGIGDEENEINVVEENSELYSIDENETNPLLKESGVNVYYESKQEGAVKREVYFELFKQGGGVKMAALVLFLAIMAQVAASWSDYFVSFWVDTEQNMSGFRMNHTTNSTEYNQMEDSHNSIMMQYSFVILAAATFTMLRSFSFFYFFSRVSMNIHTSILDRIMNSGVLFFDTNLSGNVVNRFSRDLGIVDERMPQIAFEVLRRALEICGMFIVISSVNVFFIIPSLIFSILLYLARRLYLAVGRSIQRMEGATRSPVIGHLNTTIEGLTTIRAHQAQIPLQNEFDQHQNHNSSAAYMYYTTLYTFFLYLNLLGWIYTVTIMLTFFFWKTDSQAGEIGLALTQSFTLTEMLKWIIIQWAELENQMTSSERVLEYTKIKTENIKGEEAANWPSRGKIVYKEVNLQYSPTSERVLKNITFTIEPKAKIGVVGRTGAGKSSIISCLFKMYEFEGLISIDDKDINKLDVSQLRSHISIIPQDPVLFSGTIRNNLDPKKQFDDNELWVALDEVEMKSVVESLNSDVVTSGFNFSIGQRQLICLARAVVHRSKILILDEATANIDPETDKLIQQTVKRVFCDCTVITVAHRLNTIMDSDKVLVMNSGTVVEFDSPAKLLQNKTGMFYKMVNKLCY